MTAQPDGRIASANRLAEAAREFEALHWVDEFGFQNSGTFYETADESAFSCFESSSNFRRLLPPW